MLLVTAAAVAIACSVGFAFTDESDEVSVDRTASEPNENLVTVPEFIATNEWQELLPGQGVPPVSNQLRPYQYDSNLTAVYLSVMSC